jgi:amino-acid N-acetyltransferase
VISFRTANDSDLEVVLQLLALVGLPSEGVEQFLNNFVIAEDGDDIVGCAGFERYEAVGLLRSVAIRPDKQGSGLGSKLVEHILGNATKIGIEEVVLLTTTAKPFFVRRHGFTITSRESYDDRLKESPEWTLPRCSSAVVLGKTLPR